MDGRELCHVTWLELEKSWKLVNRSNDYTYSIKNLVLKDLRFASASYKYYQQLACKVTIVFIIIFFILNKTSSI